MQIDLTLAVNYLPAVLCLLRLVWYLFALTVIAPGGEIGGYLIVGLVLYLDRVVFRVYMVSVIFDTSGVILAVYFANVYHLVQASNTASHMNFFGLIVNVWWMICCIFMIVEPARLRGAFEKSSRLYHVLPAMIMVLALIAQVQVHCDREDAGTKFARGVAFALLSIIWVYIVGIHQSQALEPLKDNSSHFISRFAPVLYLPPPVAILFAVLAGGAVAYQYVQLYRAVSEPPAEADVEAPKEPDPEEMFRLARGRLN
jgi:hypothetical protein